MRVVTFFGLSGQRAALAEALDLLVAELDPHHRRHLGRARLESVANALGGGLYEGRAGADAAQDVGAGVAQGFLLLAIVADLVAGARARPLGLDELADSFKAKAGAAARASTDS